MVVGSLRRHPHRHNPTTGGCIFIYALPQNQEPPVVHIIIQRSIIAIVARRHQSPFLKRYHCRPTGRIPTPDISSSPERYLPSRLHRHLPPLRDRGPLSPYRTPRSSEVRVSVPTGRRKANPRLRLRPRKHRRGEWVRREKEERKQLPRHGLPGRGVRIGSFP